MMKKEYKRPEINIIKLDFSDIVTASGDINTNRRNPNTDEYEGDILKYKFQ